MATDSATGGPAEYRKLIEQFGPWTAHSLRVTDDLWTTPVASGFARSKHIMSALLTCCGGSLTGKRILDLGCLEGGFLCECAALGAEEAVGIECKPANLAKVRYTIERQGLENARVVDGDARAVDKQSLGRFDVILILGLLYHFEADAIVPFLERIADMCRGAVIIDTLLAAEEWTDYPDRLRKSVSEEMVQVELGGKTVEGRHYAEFAPGVGREDMDRRLWAAMDNRRSFLPTRDALVGLLGAVGFDDVWMPCASVYGPNLPRKVFLCWKRERWDPVLFRGTGPGGSNLAPESGVRED